LRELPPDFATLRAEAEAEAFMFLSRLSERWRPGGYDADADASLHGVFDGDALAAIGAQTYDEYDPAPEHRRLRHVYVRPAYRRTGVGRALAQDLIQSAFALAPRLHLRATHDLSRAFWEAIGFVRVERSDRSHAVATVTTFSPDERERYARHIMLKEIGGPGQQRLKAATVAIVGMGGLGAPAALYLAAAGVGRLRLIDHDRVSLSNLQRQVLYKAEEVGALKVDCAARALKALNPHVEVEAIAARFPPPFTGEVAERSEAGGGTDVTPPSVASPVNGGGNAPSLLAGADLVLDGADDFATRFAVNAACHQLGITLISGAVGRWEGQVATFKSGRTKHLPPDQRLPCYRCLVPDIPPDAETCETVGIVGALTGVIGSLMALEAIKEIAGAGESLAGRVVVYDALTARVRVVGLNADPACSTCGKDGR
jgi:molybdopterin/thiamine biosynthesis adenylyltransferase